jgi:hypothetical protein
MAEEARQKYDLEMATYRQAGFSGGAQSEGVSVTTSAGTASQSGATYTYTGGLL